MPILRIRVLLFLSSYWPLFFILAVLYFSKNWIVSAICAAICVIGPLSLWWYLRYCRKRHQRKCDRLCSYQRRDSEVMSYIASYIVPLATLSLDLFSQMVILITFLLVLLILYVNSNMIYINPILNIFGFHLYEIEIEGSNLSHYYLARKRLIRNENIYYVHISDEIWLEVK
jgi:hypothetical protein